MASLLECALNFSEGRRQDVIQAIVGAVQGARLLDVSSDADHNRTVVSFVGSPQEAAAAALAVSALPSTGAPGCGISPPGKNASAVMPRYAGAILPVSA